VIPSGSPRCFAHHGAVGMLACCIHGEVTADLGRHILIARNVFLERHHFSQMDWRRFRA